MVENIILRICSQYWVNEKKESGYDFLGYEAELKTSESQEWGKEELKQGHGCSSYASAKGNLEQIGHQILLFEHYSKMIHPSYEILLWKGNCPMKTHKRNKTGLLTKIPEEDVKGGLSRLFDEYYHIKDLVSQKQYEQAHEIIFESRVGCAFLFTINDEHLKKFYIGLRKISEEKATELAGFFPPSFYYELETAFLHNSEGKKQTRRKFKLRDILVINT